MRNQSKYMVQETLESIASVRREANKAFVEGNMTRHVELMCNLSALEACLVIEVTSLMRDLDLTEDFKKAA
jgi:hypothetical protein